MKQVFLSYSTSDKLQVLQIRNLLECSGVSCWMGSRNILGGNTFTEEITKAIDQCRVFVLVMSKAAQESNWVFRELEYAIQKKKVILPYILEEMEFNSSFHFMLAVNNGINAGEFEGDSKEELLRRILFFINADMGDTGKKFTVVRHVCPVCGSERVGDCLGFWEVAYLRILKPVMITWGILAAANIVFVLLSFLAVTGSALLTAIRGYEENLLLQFFRTEAVKEAVELFLRGYGIVVAFCVGIPLLAAAAGIHAENRRVRKGIVTHTFRCHNCNSRFRKKIKIDV